MGIAKRASGSRRDKVPTAVRAQALRDMPEKTSFGFVLPEESAPAPVPRDSGKPHWRQADVRRAIAAAERAGLTNYRIEIGLDGTISIVVGGPAASPAA